ncbi:cupin domain-containing protein [Pandoraea pneumonica]|uniref:cupin domain-containing protein n=1 Tax=Pandoraea pneumonica TaxID=2508299 RepID=UPI003CE9D849
MLIQWDELPQASAPRPGMSRKTVCGEQMSAMWVDASPDTPFDGRLHHHPHEQMLLVVEGTVSVQIEDDVVHAGPGQLVYFRSLSRHAVVGVGPQPCHWASPIRIHRAVALPALRVVTTGRSIGKSRPGPIICCRPAPMCI